MSLKHSSRIALLVIHTKTFFPRMLELGKMLKKTGVYEPVFYLAYKQRWIDISKDVDRLKSEQLKLSPLCKIEGMGNYEEKHTIRTHTNNILCKIKDSCSDPQSIKFKIRKCLASIYYFFNGLLLLHFIRELRYIYKRLRFVKQLIGSEGAEILVLSIDIQPYDTSIFIKAAHSKKIPAVVAVSCTRLLEETRAVYSEDSSLSLSKWANYVTGKIYPKWCAEYKGKKFLMLNPGKIIAKELLNLAPSLPWIDGSSNADAVLAENEKFYKEGLSVGLSKERVFLTGQTVHDDMATILSEAELHRSKLYQQLNLSQGKPMILTSLIPDYGRERPNIQFKSYEECIEFWIKTLAAVKDRNVVVCLHPSMKYEDFIYLERWGAKLSQVSVANLMPLCEIFVTSVSSTMSYAIACGKPVVNFDAFLYRNTMFQGEAGIITVEDKSKFVSIIGKLTQDRKFYNEVAGNQAVSAHRWGILDGKVTNRIISIFDMVCKKYN